MTSRTLGKYIRSVLLTAHTYYSCIICRLTFFRLVSVNTRQLLALNVYFARATPTYLINELARLAIVALNAGNKVNED